MCAFRCAEGDSKGSMRTTLVVPGRCPAWINDQLRYVANRLADDGRVMVAFTDGFDSSVRLPGHVGSSTVLGIAQSGYPLWTGRSLAAIGFRHRADNVVIVLFDRARTGIATLSALVARIRGERVVVQDM